MTVHIDAYGDSVNQYGEELCGDRMEILRDRTGATAILVNGGGGGAKANLQASVTLKMIVTMAERGEPIGDIAEMMAETQPRDQKEDSPGTSFTMIQANYDGTVCTTQVETPEIILLQRGKPVEMKIRKKLRQGRLIRTGQLASREADTIIAVSSGMLRAGAQRSVESGWKLDHIATFMEHAYHSQITAEKLVRLLLTASSSLSHGKPEKDFSALAFRMNRQ